LAENGSAKRRTSRSGGGGESDGCGAGHHSVHLYRPSYLRHKKLLWEEERRSPIAAGDAGSPLQRGGQSDETITPDEDERHSLSGGTRERLGEMKVPDADKQKIKDRLRAILKQLAPKAPASLASAPAPCP
jgi:hypothetical protein